jgi:DNA-directed RNA polymerase beta subunit
MTWEGYNYEDAILHFNEKPCHARTCSPPSILRSTRREARETKLGPEEITRDIPERVRRRAEGP